ncbi:HbrB-like-domain-containing protein [Schizophyllum amplum]|uniref:HbrB-like-domain-containing protein n=1 Tax=Schizophyllum amplum TaxID=97359 RepID=A0A550CY64_9AGAR|nr:HbrB-like-domain-containing protein [Auriculariopsis ampla]
MAGWPPSPRRSHEHSRGRRSSEDHPWPNTAGTKGFLEVETAPRKRSASSDGPRVAADGGGGKRFLSSGAAEVPYIEKARGPDGGEKERGTGPRGLGALADKLHAHAAHHHHNRFHPAHLLHHHHHSDQPSTMATSPAKPHGRTYDSKLVTREMHRLGNLAHLPAGLAGAAAIAAPAVATANIPAPVPAASTSAGGDPWGALHVHVLPLFNGEPLRIPIEDLNVLVKRHIQTVVSAAPSKAIAALEHDLTELIASGMVTLNAKLVGVDDDKLLIRVVEIWGFFWDQVLPYVEGVLLPLQTDPLLSSLYRTPKQAKASQIRRTSSPTRHQSNLSASNLNSGSLPSIDVRTAALRAFRDRVIAPLAPRLHARLAAARDAPLASPSYQQPRLQQMLLVLSSQARARPQTTFSALTAPPTPPAPAEAAITDLLRTLRAPVHAHAHPAAPGAPSSFLAGGVPRDRRGRVGRRAGNWQGLSLDGLGDEVGAGGLTPRNDREREFLEALRSPDPEPDVRASAGGWGLGGGKEEIRGMEEIHGMEEEDDEPTDWDSAQAVVERMVGMNAATPTEASTRRRPT